MKKFIRTALISTLAGVAASSMAATQGTLGATSTGNFLITAVLQDLVQVSSLDDLNLGTYPGTGALSGSEGFCVYRNGTGAYTATLTGSGAASAFTIASGANTMAYTVTYNGSAIITGGTTATQAGNSSVTDCGGANVANNATIAVNITQAVLQASPTGTYTGTLTILVSPV
jgi:hypothetical protein